MSSDVSHFSEEYWTNSLAIGHPLVYRSHANSEDLVDESPDKDDNHVGANFIMYFIC
jgi:microsomal dipeptidase-like Zn-dependent dipeptidase